MQIQDLLGSDIEMQFDECVKLPCPEAEARRAMLLSLKWAERSKTAFVEKPGRALFGIVQGGDVESLRVDSAKALADMRFDGYALGGLAVGEPQATMLAMITCVLPWLPEAKPRYLMGVGTPDDLIEAVRRGIDMFDCVLPTRAGRHGLAYTRAGRHEFAQRPPRGRCLTRRFLVVQRGGADLFPRLSASPRQGGRDSRHDAADRNQSRLLSGSDVGHAPRHRRRMLWRVL